MTAISFMQSEVTSLVSVIIPTYRCEQYIGETLESISRQTYQDWEVIVIEDGPAGPTRRIVEDFARRHPSHRIEYLSNGANYGQAHARNIAFSQAAGEFIALLDSDDRWFPEHLARSVKELREADADLVYSTVVMIEDQTDRIIGTWGPDQEDLDDFPHRLFRRNFVTPSATVLRRQTIADVGSWDVELPPCEDLSFWLRCYAAGKRFHYVGGCHCLYRKNHESACTTKECLTAEMFATVAERYLHLPGLNRKLVQKLVAKAYARAARGHAKTDPTSDSSADRTRAVPLLLRAWRIRPTKPIYLFKALKIFVVDRLHGRQNPAKLAPVVPYAAPTTVAARSVGQAA
jgi:glycosyltransferase involved in cell wall biosynthesis